MNHTPVNSTWHQGLWQNNPALVQLLGLCPLLAVSNTAINGLALGLATLLTLTLSNVIVSATRQWLIAEIRIPVFVLLIATIVTIIGMLMNAYAYQLYLQLGIFIPLIITNCTILARAESFASRNTVLRSLIDGLSHGLGFAAVLFLMGVIRELAGSGTLFAGAALLPAGQLLPTIEIAGFRGLLFAALPPGAFIVLGLLLAGKNYLDSKAYLHRSTAASSVNEVK